MSAEAANIFDRCASFLEGRPPEGWKYRDLADSVVGEGLTEAEAGQLAGDPAEQDRLAYAMRRKAEEWRYWMAA